MSVTRQIDSRAKIYSCLAAGKRKAMYVAGLLPVRILRFVITSFLFWSNFITYTRKIVRPKIIFVGFYIHHCSLSGAIQI